jgi:hypothetical protein
MFFKRSKDRFILYLTRQLKHITALKCTDTFWTNFSGLIRLLIPQTLASALQLATV